jgi:hypothetical protein
MLQVSESYNGETSSVVGAEIEDSSSPGKQELQSKDILFRQASLLT